MDLTDHLSMASVGHLDRDSEGPSRDGSSDEGAVECTYLYSIKLAVLHAWGLGGQRGRDGKILTALPIDTEDASEPEVMHMEQEEPGKRE